MFSRDETESDTDAVKSGLEHLHLKSPEHNQEAQIEQHEPQVNSDKTNNFQHDAGDIFSVLMDKILTGEMDSVPVTNENNNDDINNIWKL